MVMVGVGTTFQGSRMQADLDHLANLLAGLRSDEAAAKGENLYAQGCRVPELLDHLTRALTDLGRFDEAVAFLEAEKPLVLSHFPLLKRLAALLFCLGRVEEANQVAPLALKTCTPRLLAKVRRLHAEMEALLATPERLRPAALRAAGDPEKSWYDYARELEGQPNIRTSSILFINSLLLPVLERTLAENPDIRTVVNFGSLFGWAEFVLATRNPEVLVAGFDWTPVSKRLNDQVFSRPNLRYLDGNFARSVRPLLAERGGKALLWHGRTGTLMYPEELIRLYGDCRDLGVANLILSEDVNFDMVRGHYPDFSRPGPRSRVLGGQVMLHDYPHYLGKAGYRVVRQSRQPYGLTFGNTFNGDAMVVEIIEAELT